MKSKTSLPPRPALLTISVIGLGGAMLAGSGCSHRPIVVQSPPATVVQNPAPAAAPAPAPTSTVIVTKEAPPPPRPETPPPQPAGGTVWIPGYWAMQNGQQQWVPGHWDTPPQPNQNWVPPRWEQQGNGYVFVPGYWQ
ncbi:MAG TPA: YXWGXW repeat-containing protein [Opitutus sp.]|nr:YXWGXW repeat-containing protein [Opitutus sp.]